MNPILGKLRRGWDHVAEGTVLNRLAFGMQQFQTHKRFQLWQKSTLHQAKFEVSLGSGIKMMLYRDSVFSQLLFCNNFELPERRFLQRFLRPGDVFVDVGANIGLFTLLAAHRVGPRGKVHAFEPTQRTFERLQQNVRLNGWSHVTCHNVGLSDKQGHAEIHVWLEGFDAWNTIGAPTLNEGCEIEKITTSSWDDFVTENELTDQVTMMKLDVEGWEQHVLRGGSKNLARAGAPILQVEFTEPASRASGSSCADLYRTLQDLGYKMYECDPTGKKLTHYPARDEYPAMNLFAIKVLEPVLCRLAGKSVNQAVAS